MKKPQIKHGKCKTGHVIQIGEDIRIEFNVVVSSVANVRVLAPPHTRIGIVRIAKPKPVGNTGELTT